MNQRQRVRATIVLVIIVGVGLIGSLIAYNAIANGSEGSPSYYDILAASMSKGTSWGNGDTCYLTVVIMNNYNVNIDSLVVKVNGTEVWYTNSVIAPKTVYSTDSDSSYDPGGQSGPAAFFFCPSVSVGQAYPFFLGVYFANGQNENLTTTLFVTPVYFASYEYPLMH